MKHRAHYIELFQEINPNLVSKTLICQRYGLKFEYFNDYLMERYVSEQYAKRIEQSINAAHQDYHNMLQPLLRPEEPTTIQNLEFAQRRAKWCR